MERINQYKKIVESIKLLSLSFEEQEKCFPEFVDVPFEVIDTFENALLQLPNLIEIGKFENKVIASILRLKNMINFTSSNLHFKDLKEEQFKVASEWNRVRDMARDTLQIMGEPLENPDLNYI